MSVTGERGAPAAAAAAVSESDSEHECPDKEPEFVIDIVEDRLSQPLLSHPDPRRQQLMMMQPPGTVLFQQQQQQLTFAPSLRIPIHQPELEYADMPKECTNCFIFKIVHCILVLICVGVTLMLVARLPEEYKEGDNGFIVMCPVLIAVLAVHWLMLSKYDKEQC